MTYVKKMTLFEVPPLMVFEYGGDMNKLLDYTSNIEYEQTPGNLKSIDHYILDHNELSDLKKFCVKSVAEYLDEVCGFNDEVEIQQSWINVNGTGQHHPEHFHPNSLISGVFFLKSDESKNSPLVFKSELHKSNFSVALPTKDSNTFRPCIAASVMFPSITGTLLLFSSTITHQVPVNKSNTPRVSLSFNTYPKLPFGDKRGLSYVRG